MMMRHLHIRASVAEADGTSRTLAFEGQEARTLRALIEAGDRGVTSLEISSWALRTSHYVFKLRGAGLVIEMVRERHDGPVPGHHGRYRLLSRVSIVEPGAGREVAA